MAANEELRIVALNGCLGYGYDLASLRAGVEAQPHQFGADAGSTDAGPYYLGTGTSMVRREQIERDLTHALVAARACGVPLVIGSAGIAGGEPNLQLVRDILLQVARREGLRFKLATLHAEISADTVLAALRSGGIEAMPGVGALTEAAVRESVRIVGQMGTEPFAHALAAGADVVLAGRACDTAIYAALPISRGFDPGLSLHLAKIMECGAQCAVPQGTNDCLLGTMRNDHFLVRPLSPRRICTVQSVAAHTMYEQGDPLWLHEPEGRVDMREALFEQIDPQTVRVAGSRFIATPQLYIKLEGARLAGFRAFTIAGIRDRDVIANLDAMEATVREAVHANLGEDRGRGSWRMEFKVYGRDAVLGRAEPLRDQPAHEVGVLVEVVAQSQALANHVLSLARSSLLHCPFPGRKTTAGNLAFPFSPSDSAAGEVYEFSVYHLMRTADQRKLFSMDMENVK